MLLARKHVIKTLIKWSENWKILLIILLGIVKNNYDVYTTDYDPDHEHVDRMSMEVMDVNKAMNKIKQLEIKLAKKDSSDIEQDGFDRLTLTSLTKEMGIKEGDLEWT